MNSFTLCKTKISVQVRLCMAAITERPKTINSFIPLTFQAYPEALFCLFCQNRELCGAHLAKSSGARSSYVKRNSKQTLGVRVIKQLLSGSNRLDFSMLDFKTILRER